MTTIVLPQSVDSQPGGHPGTRRAVIVALAVWLLLVLSFGIAGVFVNTPGRPPLPIAIGVIVPLAIFFASLRLSRSFREFVIALDLRFIVAVQAWRWAGLDFLSLYAHKILPAVFAFPAGLGDMAIGATAPLLLLSLIRKPGFAASTSFIRWNVLGILDLVIAIGIGTVSSFLATGAPGEISTAPMATLPLLVIPVFLVPLFLMLHSVALMQSRQVTRGA